MHAADREVVARAGALELLGDVAEFRVPVAEDERAQQRVVEGTLRREARRQRGVSQTFTFHGAP